MLISRVQLTEVFERTANAVAADSPTTLTEAILHENRWV